MTFTGYIYRVTGTCGKCYYGSTKCIYNRKSKHKRLKDCSSKLLQDPLIFEVIDTREYKLIKTLRLVEQFYMDNNECVNIYRAYRNKKKIIKIYNAKRKIKNKIPYHCICGKTITTHSKPRHFRTKFHINYISNN
jgi:hypothetical protein